MWKRAVIGLIVISLLWVLLQFIVFGTIRDPLVGPLVVGSFFLFWLMIQLAASAVLRLFRR